MTSSRARAMTPSELTPKLPALVDPRIRRVDDNHDLADRILQRQQEILDKYNIPPELLRTLRLLADVPTRERVNEIMARVDLTALVNELSAINGEFCSTIQCVSCGGEDAVDWRTRVCGTCLRAQPSQPSAKVLVRALGKARSAGLLATLTKKQWLEAVDHFADRCAYCGGPWSLVEHVVPVSAGGGTTAANCVPACMRCNGWKGKRALAVLIKSYANYGDQTRHNRLRVVRAWLDERPVNLERHKKKP